jgi:hypothetical protein
MSPLALRILDLFIDHAKGRNKNDERWYENSLGYIASWTLSEKLGGTASMLDAVRVKIHPENEYEAALRELIDLGLIEEMKDLGCRFKLVVKEPMEEQLKPVEPTVAEYWKQPPSVQGKLREKVQPPVEPSRCITKMESEVKS